MGRAAMAEVSSENTEINNIDHSVAVIIIAWAVDKIGRGYAFIVVDVEEMRRDEAAEFVVNKQADFADSAIK